MTLVAAGFGDKDVADRHREPTLLQKRDSSVPRAVGTRTPTGGARTTVGHRVLLTPGTWGTPTRQHRGRAHSRGYRRQTAAGRSGQGYHTASGGRDSPGETREPSGGAASRWLGAGPQAKPQTSRSAAGAREAAGSVGGQGDRTEAGEQARAELTGRQRRPGPAASGCRCRGQQCSLKEGLWPGLAGGTTAGTRGRGPLPRVAGAAP